MKKANRTTPPPQSPRRSKSTLHLADQEFPVHLIQLQDVTGGMAWLNGIAHLLMYYHPEACVEEEIRNVGWLLEEIVDACNRRLEMDDQERRASLEKRAV